MAGDKGDNTVNEKMTAIADNIRNKTGGTTPLTLDDMANGVNEVYEAGVEFAEKEMWDKVLKKGKRKNAEYTFNEWECEYICLPFVFKPTTRTIQCFANNPALKKVEKQYFDFSGTPAGGTATHGGYYTFAQCPILEEVEDIGLPAQGGYDYTWRACLKLHTIELVRSTSTTTYTGTFNECRELANIRFEGEIGRTISFSYSPLTVESMKSVITHLKDYAGTEKAGVYTLTLKDTCKTLMAKQGVIEEFGGKTYDAYIADIGWNLA